MSADTEQRLRLAYHEAAHAVVALNYGFKFHDVWIDQDHGMVSLIDRGAGYDRQLGAIAFSGHAAEVMFFAGIPQTALSKEDAHAIDRAVAAGHDALHLAERARSAVRHAEQQIAAVAHALVARGRLSFADVLRTGVLLV